jgi:hypothetical protein
MGPKLHDWYAAGDAIEAFGDTKGPESFCDGQFVVLPSVILCFVTVGQTIDEPHVPSPSGVVWRPKPGTKPSDDHKWLPEKVREVWDRKRAKKLRHHHLFLRTPAENDFFYAGEAHLGSYGSSRTKSGDWGLAANFSLSEKLPRDVWLKLGGYPGWLVDVNHKCHEVAAGDVTTFERLAGELTQQEFSHLYMTRYEQDSLTVHTNAQRGWLMYQRDPDDGGVYSRDLDYSGPAGVDEVFRCVCGIDLEFAASQTLPREMAGRAAVEFFKTGQMPQCVHWESE